jgi:drug/metabolite transporter (DMT)-like permease
MMGAKYVLGVFVAIICGVINSSGVMLQKKVVNEVPLHLRDKGLMRRVMIKPLWILGLFLQVGLGAALFVLAQYLIGPALVPGLMASGLIVLALGSVKLMGEKLSLPEYAGIFLMTVAILLLGLSQMAISVEVGRASLALSSIIRRIAIFTVSLFGLGGIMHLVALHSAGRKGVIVGFSNGFLYALSNFWVSPISWVAAPVLGGKADSSQLGIFIAAGVILIFTNVVGIIQIQQAFRFGQVSNVIPVQQIPIQTAPVLVYFYAFSLRPPNSLSSALIIIGVLLIIFSGFLLGRRQEQMEKIH